MWMCQPTFERPSLLSIGAQVYAPASIAVETNGEPISGAPVPALLEPQYVYPLQIEKTRWEGELDA